MMDDGGGQVDDGKDGKEEMDGEGLEKDDDRAGQIER